MSYISKHSITGQQSTVDAELAQLASEGFARLLADSGHAHLDATHTAAGGGGDADATGGGDAVTLWCRDAKTQRLSYAVRYACGIRRDYAEKLCDKVTGL